MQLVLVLLLIGWKTNATVLSQSLIEVSFYSETVHTQTFIAWKQIFLHKFLYLDLLSQTCCSDCPANGVTRCVPGDRYNVQEFQTSLYFYFNLAKCNLDYWVKSETILWHYVIRTYYCHSASSLRFSVCWVFVQGCNDSTVGFSCWITLSITTQHFSLSFLLSPPIPIFFIVSMW